MNLDLDRPVAGMAADQSTAALASLPQPSRWPGRLAWTLCVFSTLLFAGSVVLPLISDSAPFVANLLVNVLGTPTLLAYATVGAIIAARHPRNPIGWIFCAAAFIVAFGSFAEEYARYALITRPGALPGGAAMAWLAGWPQDVGLFLMVSFLPLLFPDGKLPTRRWRSVALFAAAAIVLVGLFDALKPGPVNSNLDVVNPLGTEAILPVADLLTDPLILATIILCGASVIVRFRRARGDERQQLKWFTYAASLALALFTAFAVLGVLSISMPDATHDALMVLAIAAFPLATGIAMLKYRLYNIDLLINRTLVYVPLTGILAGLYSASIALFQKLFVTTTGEKSDAAIVITTLILASSFTPIKNSLQTVVDKRFKEAPDPTKKLRLFGEQVRSFVQLNSVELITQRLLDEVVAAFAASGGAIYLGEHGHMRLTHASQTWTGDARLSLPLHANGAQIGLIAIGERRNGWEYSVQDCQTLQEIVDVVAQAIELAEREQAQRNEN